MQHRLALLGVEPFEKLVGLGTSRGMAYVHTHVRPNLPPFNDTFALARPEMAHS
jgi:hypothetical protein